MATGEIKYGRVITVVISTFIMAFSSFGLSLLPSYEVIGVYASFLFLSLRALQGFASVGEVAGARIYIAESVPSPQVHYYMTMVDLTADLGSFFALVISIFLLFVQPEHGWRFAFAFGSSVALLGSIARVKLKETPDFLCQINKNKPSYQTSHYHALLYYFCVECLTPIGLYFCYIYLGEILRKKYGLSLHQVMLHNLGVVTIEILGVWVYAKLSVKIFPINIIKYRTLALLFFLPFLPILLHYSSHQGAILVIQGVFILLCRGADPGHAVFLKAFPVIGRYTKASMIFACSRALIFVITSYLCVYLGHKFCFNGIVVLFMSVASISFWGVLKFIKSF